MHETYTKNVHEKNGIHGSTKKQSKRTKHIRCTAWHLYTCRRVFSSEAIGNGVFACILNERILENAHWTYEWLLHSLVTSEHWNQCAAIEIHDQRMVCSLWCAFYSPCHTALSRNRMFGNSQKNKRNSPAQWNWSEAKWSARRRENTQTQLKHIGRALWYLRRLFLKWNVFLHSSLLSSISIASCR